MQPVFALSGDYGYINQIETTAKSIFYHHPTARVYVINKDIPQEWFANINNRLPEGKIINLKLAGYQLADEHVSQPHINEMSYGRIMIPKLIADADRVLYLDSDAVVDADLSDLFELDMGDHLVAAVPDLLYQSDFNSGVLLFNMPKFREQPDLVDQMLEAGQTDEQLAEGDQSILNKFFRDSYLHLPLEDNWAIGYDFLCAYYPHYDHDYFTKTNAVTGKIVHFTGPNKPWHQFSTSRERNKWWQYRNLEWGEVASHRPFPANLDYDEQGQVLIFTNSEYIKDLEAMVKALPKVTFNVVAWTAMGDYLTALIHYPNVHLYPSVVPPVLDRLTESATAYLDINYGGKNDDYLARFHKTGKPILSFDEVNSSLAGEEGYESFANDDMAGMVARIKLLVSEPVAQ